MKAKEIALFKEIRALAKIYPNDNVFASEVRKIIQTVIEDERINDLEKIKKYAAEFDAVRSKNLYAKIQREKEKFENKIIENDN